MSIQSNTQKRSSLTEVISIAGSVAAVTAVGVLWLEGQVNTSFLIIEVPLIAAHVSILLGLVALAYYAIRGLYLRYFTTKDALLKFAYLTIAIPVGAGLIALAGKGISLVLLSLVAALL